MGDGVGGKVGDKQLGGKVVLGTSVAGALVPWAAKWVAKWVANK